MPGAKVRLRIHPLFALVGVLSAFTGGLFVFLTATLAAIEHELCHAFAARRFGYRLDRIVLMPYGAVISGDIADMGTSEKLWVLFMGPLANGLTAVFFIALWWLFPVTYPYTDVAAYVSLSLFFVNLLPAYPLDGGRALRLFLSKYNKKTAAIVTTVLNLLVTLAVFGYFIYSCVKGAPQISALAFSILLGSGTFLKGGSYEPVVLHREKSLKRGMDERRIVIDGGASLRHCLRFLSDEKHLVFVLYENGEYFGELSEEEYLSALAQGDYSKTLKECLPVF